MARTRFGPVNDAGVVIDERTAQRSIIPSSLGSTFYVGRLNRGPVGEIIETSSRTDMEAKVGGYHPDSLVPDAAFDFWKYSRSTGFLGLLRLTDGNEKKATLDLYDRSTERALIGRLEAENGGAWGGRKRIEVLDLTNGSADITETTITLPVAFNVLEDEFKGGKITITGANKSYDIVSNTAKDGSTAGVITLSGNAKASTDYGASTDKQVILELDNFDVWGRENKLEAEIGNGDNNPDTEWSLNIYLDNSLVKSYPNLSMDQNSQFYWVDVINDDGTNYYVRAVDLFVGTPTAENRPANWYGVVPSTDITSKSIDLSGDTFKVTYDGGNTGTSTVGAFTPGADLIEDTLQLVYDSANTDWVVTSLDKQAGHTFPTAVDATAYSADNSYSFGFTITENSPANGDTITIKATPQVENNLVNGRVFYPEVATAPRSGWLITSNNEVDVNITTGDLTIGSTVSGNIAVRLEFRQSFSGGYDGVAPTVNDYQEAFDTGGTSVLDQLKGKGYGIIKFATPGITQEQSKADAILIQKSGLNYACNSNHKFRLEVPSNILDDFEIKSYVHDDIGKAQMLEVCANGFRYVNDPVLSGKLKLVSHIGSIHGWEARVASDYGGYHKPAAGVNITFTDTVKLPRGKATYNGELLNLAGIQRIERKAGNFVLWGMRMPTNNTAFLFMQQRTQFSHYQHVMSENFDDVIFQLNDPKLWAPIESSLRAYFLGEYSNGALQGATFDDAVNIKIDFDNNPQSSRAAGDLFADISLYLADSVERFTLRMSKLGVSDQPQ